MSTRRVREELALRIQNGGLTTQHDTEKRRESFLIWPTFDRNFNLQMGKSINFTPFLNNTNKACLCCNGSEMAEFVHHLPKRLELLQVGKNA